MGPRWLEFFRAARGASADSIDSAIRFAAGPSADRQEAAGRAWRIQAAPVPANRDRRPARPARRQRDDARDVAARRRMYSRRALACARLIVGTPSARVGSDLCVLAMGKLGAQELNLSSDIDLIYLSSRSPIRRRPRAAGADRRDADRDLVAANVFASICVCVPADETRRWSSRSRARSAITRAIGETWERAALLRARPGRRRDRGRPAAARRTRPFHLSPLSRLRHVAPIARDEAPDRARTALAGLGRAQYQAGLRRHSRTRIHRAGAHPDIRRTRSATAQRR